MSQWPRELWNQLKNITVDELIRALEHIGWSESDLKRLKLVR